LILRLNNRKTIVIDATTVGYQFHLQPSLVLSVHHVKLAIGQNTCSYAVFTVMPSSKVRKFVIRFLVGVNSIILTKSFLFAQTADVQNGVLLRMLASLPYERPAPVEE